MIDGARSLAVFIDFENLALGFQGRRDRFEVGRVLERLVEKGKIVAKKAYADWNRFSAYTSMLHEAAIELIEIPRRGQSGKNSADIRLCVDAMDLAYSKDHIDTFAIVSGDSDFSPLVSKLKELGKHVIGLGMEESTSDLLRDNCDEFIYYEDLGRKPVEIEGKLGQSVPDEKRKVFALLTDSLEALRRENKEVIWSSMVKDTMKRKKPSFNETYHGYRTFSELLEDAQRFGILELETDKRSRTYIVTRFGGESLKPAGATPAPAPPRPTTASNRPAPSPIAPPATPPPQQLPPSAEAEPVASTPTSNGGEGNGGMSRSARRRRQRAAKRREALLNGSESPKPPEFGTGGYAPTENETPPQPEESAEEEVLESNGEDTPEPEPISESAPSRGRRRDKAPVAEPTAEEAPVAEPKPKKPRTRRPSRRKADAVDPPSEPIDTPDAD